MSRKRRLKRKKFVNWFPIDPRRYRWDKEAKLLAKAGTPLKLIAKHLNKEYNLNFSVARWGNRLHEMGVWVSEEKARLETLRAENTWNRILDHRGKWAGFTKPTELQKQMSVEGRRNFLRVK